MADVPFVVDWEHHWCVILVNIQTQPPTTLELSFSRLQRESYVFNCFHISQAYCKGLYTVTTVNATNQWSSSHCKGFHGISLHLKSINPRFNRILPTSLTCQPLVLIDDISMPFVKKIIKSSSLCRNCCGVTVYLPRNSWLLSPMSYYHHHSVILARLKSQYVPTVVNCPMFLKSLRNRLITTSKN